MPIVYDYMVPNCEIREELIHRKKGTSQSIPLTDAEPEQQVFVRVW